MRGANLRINANVVSNTAFQNREAFFVSSAKDGSFLADPDNRGKPPPNPMSDPAMMEGMMGMMKGNVAMMVPQTLIMGWINAFFSGFVISTSFPAPPPAVELALPSQTLTLPSKNENTCSKLTRLIRSTVKLPFPLTPQFKAMLQSGVGTRDLDVRWVSSLSYYFLTLFGLQPVYNFILGNDNSKFRQTQDAITRSAPTRSQTDDLKAASQIAQQMQMNPAGMMAPNQDPDKLFVAEAENLEVIEHMYILDGIEERLLVNLS
jgi:hypothetical protein